MKNRFPLVLICALPLAAAETAVELDPARTVVTFTLHDVLHTVHGASNADASGRDFHSRSHERAADSAR